MLLDELVVWFGTRQLDASAMWWNALVCAPLVLLSTFFLLWLGVPRWAIAALVVALLLLLQFVGLKIYLDCRFSETTRRKRRPYGKS